MATEIKKGADRVARSVIEAHKANRWIEVLVTLATLGVIAAELSAAQRHWQSTVVADRITVSATSPNMDRLKLIKCLSAPFNECIYKSLSLGFDERAVFGGELRDGASGNR